MNIKYLILSAVFTGGILYASSTSEAYPKTPLPHLKDRTAYDIVDRTQAIVIDEAMRLGIPVAIALAVLEKESRSGLLTAKDHVTENDNFRMLGARSKKHGLKKAKKLVSAYGHIQVLGSTAEEIGFKDLDRLAKDEVYAVRAGLTYLNILHDRYNSWDVAIMRYNGSGFKARSYRDEVIKIKNKFEQKYQG